MTNSHSWCLTMYCQVVGGNINIVLKFDITVISFTLWSLIQVVCYIAKINKTLNYTGPWLPCMIKYKEPVDYDAWYKGML
jgi:hypothetical protein